MLYDSITLLEGTEFVNLVTPAGTTFPPASLGELFFNTTSNKMFVYDGTSWITVGAGEGTVFSVDITAPSAGITATGGPVTSSGSITLALADDLAAVEALNTTGVVRRTSTNTWSAGGGINLTSEVTGTLPVANGGTGQVTLPALKTAMALTLASMFKLTLQNFLASQEFQQHPVY